MTIEQIERDVLAAINGVDVQDWVKDTFVSSYNTTKNSRLKDAEKVRKYRILMDDIAAQVDSERLGSMWTITRDALLKSVQDVHDIGVGVLDAARNITSPTMLLVIGAIVILYFVLQLERTGGAA